MFITHHNNGHWSKHSRNLKNLSLSNNHILRPRAHLDHIFTADFSS